MKIHTKISNWFVDYLTKEGPGDSDYPVCDFDRIRYEVRPGDILLVEGQTRVSTVVRTITQSTWSHAMLYLGRLHDIEDPSMRLYVAGLADCAPDTQLLLESVLGKGTVITPMDYYSSFHIRICRPRGISRTDAQKVLSFAISQLGKPYNVRQIFDLMRFLFPWAILPRRWKSSLFKSEDATDAVRTVCSTLLVDAFQSVNFPVLPVIEEKDRRFTLKKSNPFLALPKDFDTSPYFEIIKYPFISFESQGRYHNLPWSTDIVGSGKKEAETPVTSSDTKKEPVALFYDAETAVFKDVEDERKT